jgi:hypothetical protein
VNGYVVTRPVPQSGLGSNLASLAGALHTAGRLGRELIVDWRGLVFLEDKEVNYFTRYLEPLRDVDGVRIHYSPEVEIDPAEAQEFEAGALQEPLPRYVVLSKWHGPDRVGAAGSQVERRLFERLRLLPPVAEKLDAFYQERLAGRPVVGINIATGNIPPPTGRFYYGRFDTRLLANRSRFRRRVSLAVRLARRRLTATPRIFYATDSAWMSELLGSLPDAHTRRRVFPPDRAGRLYSDYRALGYSDVEASEDMVIDHFLLGRCDALIYNATMFCNYGRVVTNDYGGNARNIESLSANYWRATARRVVRSKWGYVRSK